MGAQNVWFSVLLIACIGVSGCIPGAMHQGAQTTSYTAPNDTKFTPYGDVLEASYATGDILVAALKRKRVDPPSSVLAASFVQNDNLELTSQFGRLVSEQISSRLAQHGMHIKEIKLRKETLHIKRHEGEFMLSRELKNLGGEHNAEAALVGTYSETPWRIFVTARVIRTGDNTVIASHDYSIAQNPITRDLIK